MYQLTETFTDHTDRVRTFRAEDTNDDSALHWAAHQVVGAWVYRKDPSWLGATLTDAAGYIVATWTRTILTTHLRTEAA